MNQTLSHLYLIFLELKMRIIGRLLSRRVP